MPTSVSALSSRCRWPRKRRRRSTSIEIPASSPKKAPTAPPVTRSCRGGTWRIPPGPRGRAVESGGRRRGTRPDRRRRSESSPGLQADPRSRRAFGGRRARRGNWRVGRARKIAIDPIAGGGGSRGTASRRDAGREQQEKKQRGGAGGHASVEPVRTMPTASRERRPRARAGPVERRAGRRGPRCRVPGRNWSGSRPRTPRNRPAARREEPPSSAVDRRPPGNPPPTAADPPRRRLEAARQRGRRHERAAPGTGPQQLRGGETRMAKPASSTVTAVCGGRSRCAARGRIGRKD